MFNPLKKTKKPAEVKGDISQTHITPADIIPFLLSEEDKNRIVLGRTSDGAVFIQFKDEKITEFVKQWFSILKMKVNEEITDGFYKSFTGELAKEFVSPKAEAQTKENSVVKNLDNEIIRINGESYVKLTKEEI